VKKENEREREIKREKTDIGTQQEKNIEREREKHTHRQREKHTHRQRERQGYRGKQRGRESTRRKICNTIR